MKKLIVSIVSLMVILCMAVTVFANNLGDVDNKDGITVSDARLCLRRAIGLEKYAEGSPEYIACDVDGQGGVTVADARLILRYAINLDKSFPAQNNSQSSSEDNTEETPAHTHTWDSGKITKEPTCAAAGLKTYTCTVCKTTKTESVAKLTAHKWNSGTVTKAATCKETGVKTYTCTVCKTIKTESVAKLTTHKWNSGTVTKAATCKETGVKTYTCSVCKTTKTETVAKLTTHKWDSGKVTKAATCTSTGVKTYICTVCKITKTETVAKLSHDLVKHDALPACEADGCIEYYECSVCHKLFKTDKKTETTLSAVTVKKIGTHDETEVVIAPTCTESGYTKILCKRCGMERVKEDSETDPKNHKYSKWTTNSESTCTVAGTRTAKCDNCGETTTEYLPLAEHQVDTVNPVTVTGSKTGENYCHIEFKCSVCKQTIFSVDNSGHDVRSDRDSKIKPACTTPGYETFVCKYCNYTDTKVTQPTGHSFQPSQTVPATCTVDGYMIFSGTCSVCKETIESQKVVIPSTGHEPDRQYPDCTHAVKCSRCLTEITPALGHDYTVKASDLGNDVKGFFCSRCNARCDNVLGNFNDIVNRIKDYNNGYIYISRHPVTSFDRSVTSSSYKEFNFGIYTSMVKDLYDEEMADNITEFTAPYVNNTVSYNYQIKYSNKVSELTASDIDSISVEKINGLTGAQLLADYPSTFKVGSKDYSIANYKTSSKLAPSMIKVTINVKDDELKKSGGNVSTDSSVKTHMMKIYNYDIRSELFNVNNQPSWTYTEKDGSSADGYEISMDMTLKSAKCDGKVVYYFDESTMEPIAAIYQLSRTVDQDIKMRFSVAGVANINGTMEPVINTNNNSVYLFVDYFK